MGDQELHAQAITSERYQSLDGLRGIAAVVVLLHHSLLLVPALAAPYYETHGVGQVGSWEWWLVETPLHLIWEGKAAVYVFFVLSGIVLTLPVLKTTRFSWRAFYPQRLIRLYLPVWAAVVFGVLTMELVRRSGDTGSLWLRERLTTVTPGTFIKDMTLVLGNGGLVSPLWSLRWEILFSIALPLFVWAAAKWTNLNVAKIVLCLVVVAAGGVLQNSVLLYLPMFLTGAVIATGMPALRRVSQVGGRSRFAGLVWGAAFGVGLLLMTSHWVAQGLGVPVAVVDSTSGPMLAGACIIVVSAIFWAPVSNFLTKSAVQWLGRISFSLYLVHEPIVVASGYLFGPSHVWLAILCAIPVAVLAGWLFYQFVEKPSHRLAKAVRARMSQDTAAIYF